MDTVAWLAAEQEVAPSFDQEEINQSLFRILARKHKGLYATGGSGLLVVTGSTYPLCDGLRPNGLLGGLMGSRRWSFHETKGAECLNAGHRAWKSRQEGYRLYNGARASLGSWQAKLERDGQRLDPSFDIRLQRTDLTTECVRLTVGNEAMVADGSDCMAITVAGNRLSLAAADFESSMILIGDESSIVDLWIGGR